MARMRALADAYRDGLTAWDDPVQVRVVRERPRDDGAHDSRLARHYHHYHGEYDD